MRYVAAYLLASLGGCKNITSDVIVGILQAGGVDADVEKVNFLLKELEGKDINEVLKAGQEKMSKVASAGPAVSSAPVAATSSAKTESAPVAAKKEKTPEPSEEEGADGLLDFF